MKRLCIYSSLAAILLIAVFVSGLFSQTTENEAFDIQKVREAIADQSGDSTVSGEEKIPAPERNRPLRDNYFLIVLRIIGYVALISIIVVFVLWLVKRFGLSGSSRIGGGSMDLLETLPVGQNRSILLVRVMDAILVLSQTPQNITLLERIEGTKAVELIASSKGGTSIVQFKDVFNNFIGKIKKTPKYESQ